MIKFRLNLRTSVVEADDEMLMEAYGLSGGGVLIRPDGYIALIAGSLKTLVSNFKRFK